VTNVVDFGAFIALDDGLEGLLHLSEMGDGSLKEPYSYVKKGDRLQLRISRLEPDKRRVGFTQRWGVEQPIIDENGNPIEVEEGLPAEGEEGAPVEAELGEPDQPEASAPVEAEASVESAAPEAVETPEVVDEVPAAEESAPGAATAEAAPTEG
jgi:transcriptional accessory protein Tex/SPT6